MITITIILNVCRCLLSIPSTKTFCFLYEREDPEKFEILLRVDVDIEGIPSMSSSLHCGCKGIMNVFSWLSRVNWTTRSILMSPFVLSRQNRNTHLNPVVMTNDATERNLYSLRIWKIIFALSVKISLLIIINNCEQVIESIALSGRRYHQEVTGNQGN